MHPLSSIPQPFLVANAGSLSCFWFCGDTQLQIFIPLSFPPSSKVTLTFPPWSLLFPPQFPCISCNPVLHRFYDFCIGGLEEQRYARPRAAYLSNANRLDSSKSH